MCCSFGTLILPKIGQFGRFKDFFWQEYIENIIKNVIWKLQPHDTILKDNSAADIC